MVLGNDGHQPLIIPFDVADVFFKV